MPRDPSLPYDLLIIGGGINGVGIARDAVGRGLSVLLCEKSDLASATSSASSKLIHGGLRYLEYYAFRLVREALAEREVLFANAPHIIWPLRFVMPHSDALRPAWMIRVGLWLYDHLGGPTSLARSGRVDLRASPLGAPLRRDCVKGFVYSDCWVDDARLVTLNARGAADSGAVVLVHTRCASARRDGPLWRASLIEESTGTQREVVARAIVNAAGPWVREALTNVLGINAQSGVRLVKGSHIVVPRLYEGDHAYTLQNDDRRVVFMIPYEGRFTLIGTTDVPIDGPPGPVTIAEEEIAYLCRAASRYLARPVTPAEVAWSYAGVRPLYDDGRSDPSAVTRDYVLELDGGVDTPPALSVFGGKITTYRCLAEQALEKLRPHFPAMGRPWTAGAPLPGGDLGGESFTDFVRRLQQDMPWLPPNHAYAFARRHGARVRALLDSASRLGDLGMHFGGGLYAREVDFLVEQEWAREPADVLFRRTKLGLHLDQRQRDAVAGYMAGTRVQAPAE